MLRFLAIGLLLISCAVSAQQTPKKELVFQDAKMVLPLDQGRVKVELVIALAEKEFGLTKTQVFEDYELAIMMGFYSKRIAKKQVYLFVGFLLFPPMLPVGLSQAGAAKSMKDQIAIYLASVPR
jgi:hypothetical protein